MQEDMTPQQDNYGPDLSEACVKECPKEYIPPYHECIQQYEIGIRFLSRGCIVKVGCKEIAFEKIEDAMNELQFYVAYPYEAQTKWRKIFKDF